MSKNRETFASRLGFILVSAGCAVGLGNVWKFPYVCGNNGGAIFILIYSWISNFSMRVCNRSRQWCEHWNSIA